jgi:hypothetical protein
MSVIVLWDCRRRIRRRANTLHGFARVTLPSMMVLHDIMVHVVGATAWASPSSKAMLA